MTRNWSNYGLAQYYQLRIFAERVGSGLVLYYTILYYTILYYTILYYSYILYCTILYHTIQYYTILYYTIVIQPRISGRQSTVGDEVFRGLFKYAFHSCDKSSAIFDKQDQAVHWEKIGPSQPNPCSAKSLQEYKNTIGKVLYYTILYYTSLY